jgi:hypothetical protein
VAEGLSVVLPEDEGEQTAEDIALLVTWEDAPLEPVPAASDIDEDDLIESEVTVVGFGLDENEEGGVRKQGEMTVVGVHPLDIWLEGDAYPSFGDSGGAVLDERGQVVGVISRGGDGSVIVARVDAHRWFLDPVLRREGGCVPGDPEVCDGRDNDCDGVTDPGCSRPGEPCESDDVCVEGSCEEVAGERVCTVACTPGAPGGCWSGAYCWESECGVGLCRSGTQGERAAGEPCDDDTDCETLLCRDVGSGERRCSRRCAIDALQCGGGEVCAAWQGDCGVCVPEELSSTPRGLGEPCAAGEECRTGLVCADDPPLRYCSRPCEAHGDCPSPGMHCRHEAGLCVVGDLAPLGRSCVSDDDCDSGLCGATADGVGYCTETCRPGVICPAGQSCDFEAGVCTPYGPVAGQRCDGPDGEAECSVGECVHDGDEARCAVPCGLCCPSGFECLDLESGSACWPLAPEAAPAAGCSCAAVGSWPRLAPLVLRIIGLGSMHPGGVPDRSPGL